MKINHESMIHGKCPINGKWDYYKVVVKTEEFLEISELEELLDFHRGTNKTQEDLAKSIALQLPYSCVVELSGRHSQNTNTVVTASGKELAE